MIRFFSFVAKNAPFLENIRLEQWSLVFIATISSNSRDTIAYILIYKPKLIATRKPQGWTSAPKGLVLKPISIIKYLSLSQTFQIFKSPSLSRETRILFSLGEEIDTILLLWQFPFIHMCWRSTYRSELQSDWLIMKGFCYESAIMISCPSGEAQIDLVSVILF